MHRRYAQMVLALVGLLASVLACNMPTSTVQAPPLTTMPDIPSTLPPQETVPLAPTETRPEAAPTSTSQTSTETPAPTETEPLPTTTPVPTPPLSTGPLDFPIPTVLDHWRPLDDGEYEATIILRITGGAPPYTIRHDLDVFTTWETNPAVVFTARGCTGLVHTLTVGSADGQSVKHEYWIPAPWCD